MKKMKTVFDVALGLAVGIVLLVIEYGLFN